MLIVELVVVVIKCGVQVVVGGVGVGVGQGYVEQWIEFGYVGVGKLQVQIECIEVQWIGQCVGQVDVGVVYLYVCLYWKWLVVVLQGQYCVDVVGVFGYCVLVMVVGGLVELVVCVVCCFIWFLFVVVFGGCSLGNCFVGGGIDGVVGLCLGGFVVFGYDLVVGNCLLQWFYDDFQVGVCGGVVQVDVVLVEIYFVQLK